MSPPPARRRSTSRPCRPSPAAPAQPLPRRLRDASAVMWRQLFVPPESFDFSPVAAAGEVRWLEGRGLRCHSADVLAAIELRHLRRRATTSESKQLTYALQAAIEEGRLRRDVDGSYREAKGAAARAGPPPTRLRRRALGGNPSHYYGDAHFQGRHGRTPSRPRPRPRPRHLSEDPRLRRPVGAAAAAASAAAMHTARARTHGTRGSPSPSKPPWRYP